MPLPIPHPIGALCTGRVTLLATIAKDQMPGTTPVRALQPGPYVCGTDNFFQSDLFYPHEYPPALNRSIFGVH